MTSTMAILVAIGTLIGFLAGRAYQVAARAWSDHKKTKALVPALLKAFWAAARAAIVVVTVAVAWMVGSVWVAASGVDEEPRPASSTPSPQPSPTR